MAAPIKNYSVTQEQIDEALRGLENPLPLESEVVQDKKLGPDAWALKDAGDDSIGLHVRNNQTYVVQVSKRLEIGFTGLLKAGYDQPEKLTSEIATLVEKFGRSAYYSVTLSGKHAPFLITKAPDVNRTILQRSFKVQMKAMGAEEVDEVAFVKLPMGNVKDAAGDYLAATVTPAILDRTIEILKKGKARLSAWDCDILCYARASSFLWASNNALGQTRFTVVLGWNRCRLLIMGTDGRLVAPVLPMGVMSFLEHLSTTLGEPTVNSTWLDPKKLSIQAGDSAEMRDKKILANQAIFSLFVPFAQQVKMNLYKACNDYNIQLPQHFTVLGPGAHLFRISDSLEVDLNMRALHFSGKLEPELAAAFGAALWARHETHLNMLPASGSELIEKVKDVYSITKDKLSKMMPTGTNEAMSSVSLGRFSPTKVVSVIIALAVLAICYPIFQRSQANRALASAKKEFDSLGSKKEELLRFSERQTQFEKKLMLKKMLENHRSKSHLVVREVLYNLPKAVRLNSILYRDTTVNVKGVARTQTDLESLLELFSKLDYVTNPEALSIRKTDEKVGFEVRLKVR